MQNETLDYKIQLDVVQSGYDKVHCMVHCRAGAIYEEDKTTVIMTAQPLLLSGCDVFGALRMTMTEDMGKTWSGFIDQPAFYKRVFDGEITVYVCDFSPAWHFKTKKLLGTGQTAYYKDNRLMENPRPRETAYSVFDTERKEWCDWKTVEMPDKNGYFFNSGTGCTQRVDLPDGNILLPFYFREENSPYMAASVMMCSFDGEELRYIKHGSELTIQEGRGFAEPSLTEYKGKYFLTLRANEYGYVSVSDDGINFEKPKIWTWDDGSPLPTYNTQQHWVTHSDGLFLVYTRVAENNGHVFRHRAPLFMARVDTEKLCVIRESERIVVPERGARLGNFYAVNINESETWVTVSEWMQPDGCEKYGSDNSIYTARIMWNRPNRSYKG